MRAASLVWVATMAIGCTYIEEQFTEVLPADGVTNVQVDIHRGEFVYQGSQTNDVVINGAIRGRPQSPDRQRSDASWSVEQNNQTMRFTGDSTGLGGGVFYDVTGPGDMNMDVNLNHGDVVISGVRGDLWANAGYIQADGITGSVDLRSTWWGVDARLFPQPGDTINIDADGDVCLALPATGEYNIRVWGDDDYGVFVDGMGFNWSFGLLGAYYNNGNRGDINVDISAWGGAVYVYPTEDRLIPFPCFL